MKICGLTTPEAVAAAVEAGADAVGFVFAPSPREVTIANAILLAGIARGQAKVVAVMRHPTAALAAEVQARLQPDWLQTDAADFDSVDIMAGVSTLPVFRDGHALQPETLPTRLLYEGRDSGRGETADWQTARTIAQGRELILAGGLAVDNIATAIRAVRPWGVDVSSGVEDTPGVKNLEKIAHFIHAARNAFADLQSENNA
ncbi:MAG: phosphoribosylanthranilate isomerase [Pseudomonadota bacterium]